MTYLEGEGNTTYNYYDDDSPAVDPIDIDTENKIISLNYLGFPQVSEPVPEGVNIFNIFNISAPGNVTLLENWVVLVNPNSTVYQQIRGQFEQIRHILWHIDIPASIYKLLICLYIPIVLAGVVFNLIILAIILSTAKLRADPRNSFIVTLAFSDFFLCCFTSPLTLWSILEGHWPLGENTEFLCKFLKAAQNFPIFMSSFCIGAIACDRFRFIVQPTRKQMTAKQAFCISVLLAAISTAFVSPVFLSTRLKTLDYLGNLYFCEMDVDPSNANYNLITSSFHFVLTLLIVCALYGVIYCRLRSRPASRNASVNRRRRRTNIYLALITILFFLSWTPSVLYPVLFDFLRTVLPTRLSMQFVIYAFALAFGITTAVANPILYTSLNESFRQTLKARRLGAAGWRGSTASSGSAGAALRRSTMCKSDNKQQNGGPSLTGGGGGGGEQTTTTELTRVNVNFSDVVITNCGDDGGGGVSVTTTTVAAVCGGDCPEVAAEAVAIAEAAGKKPLETAL